MFLLGHLSMLVILCLCAALLTILSDLPKGYRWLAFKSCLFGVKRLNKRIRYKWGNWVVDDTIAYSLSAMFELLMEDYEKEYKNLSISYSRRERCVIVKTTRTRYESRDLVALAALFPEKKWLKDIWEKWGKNEKQYTKFLEKLNEIDQE